jgi:3-hydroxyacyl-[acyl-carrier-protein] dehydratase
MLEDSFYTVRNLQSAENKLEATLHFNAGHVIFSGHFPGQPVVPGVCMVQMVTELAAKIVGRPLTLRNGQDIKFLRVIDPRVDATVQATVQLQPTTDGQLPVQASLFSGDTVFFKFRGLFAG